MPSFTHGAVEIAFLDEGDGDPIVLVHGFASSKEVNWVRPGWTTTLLWTGAWCIALAAAGLLLHRRFDRTFVDLL